MRFVRGAECRYSPVDAHRRRGWILLRGHLREAKNNTEKFQSTTLNWKVVAVAYDRCQVYIVIQGEKVGIQEKWSEKKQ